MSQALQSLTLTRVLGGDVYAAMISCSKGDLFQRYDTDGVYPDWEKDTTQRPVLTYHCVSSLNPTGETVPDKIDLYYDGTLVTFNAGQAVSADGRFQISGGSGGAPYRVTVLKNLCTAGSASQAGHVIKIVGHVGVNTFPATIGVDIQPRTENGLEVHIISGDTTDNPFVVDQNSGTSCRLKAEVYKGGIAVAAPKGTFRWERQDTSGWTALSETSAVLRVNPDDVDAYAVYRVTYTEGGEQCMDTQSVMDTGDPFYVGISVTDGAGKGAEATFGVGAAESESRKFTASLLARRSGGAVPSAFTCHWQLTRPDGTLLNSSFSGGKDSHGVWDKNQDQKSITVPLGFMTGNSVDSMVVTAIVEYTV